MKRLKAKFLKILISFSMVFSSCATMSIFKKTENVSAEDIQQTFYMEKNDDGTTKLGYYFGVDGIRIGANVIKGEDESISYCLSQGLSFPADSKSENPTIYTKTLDDSSGTWDWALKNNKRPTQAQVSLVQRALYAGYPTHSYQELGLTSENQAYYVTQLAIWTILENWGSRVYKLETDNSSDQALIDSMFTSYQKIMSYVNGSESAFSSDFMVTDTVNRTAITNIQLTENAFTGYKTSQALTVRPVQDRAFATSGNIGISFSVELSDSAPKGAKIVNSSGKEAYDFGVNSSNGTVFRVVLPEDTVFNGSFEVIISASVVRNAPILWRTANTSFQTLMTFGAVNSSGETKLNVSGQDEIGQIIVQKYGETASGANGYYTDEEYTDSSGNSSKLLVNPINLNKSPLEGVQFTLYIKDIGAADNTMEVKQRLKTDSNGQIVFNNLKLNDGTVYVLKETAAPAGYQLDKDKTIEVSLTAENKEKAIEIVNNKVNTKLTIDKKVEYFNSSTQTYETKQAGAGFVFGVYMEESNFGLSKDDLVAIVETNENGQIIVEGLPLNGSYYLKELKTIGNYNLNTSKYKFNLTAPELSKNSTVTLTYNQVIDEQGNIVTEILNTLDRLSISLIKQIEYVDTDGTIKTRKITSEESSLFKFSVYSDEKCTNSLGDMVYDETLGKYVFGGLDVEGTYYVKETKSQTVYEANNEVIVMNSDDAEKTLVNTLKKGSIVITKINQDTQEVMPNIEFTLTAVNGDKTFTKKAKTNSSGIVRFENLPAGYKYTIVETVPDGYINVTGDIDFDFTSSVKDLKETVYNKEEVKDINIKVIKTNGTETVKIEGVTFELYKKNNMKKVIDTKQTNENGEINFSGLEKDVYVLKETATNSHYILPTGENALTEVDLTGVENISTTTVNIKNEEIPLSINLLKVRGNSKSFNYSATIPSVVLEGEDRMANVEFNLFKVVNGLPEFIGNAKTDENGEITFTSDKIVYGVQYLLREVPVDGYSILEDLYFTIGNNIDGHTVYVKATNEEFVGEINVIKTDELDGTKLANVEFDLYFGTTFISKQKTDENGFISFKNLKAGEYSVIESKTLAGYKLDSTAKTVQINTANPTATINVKNERKVININVLKTIGDETAYTVEESNSFDISNVDKTTYLNNVVFELYKIDKANNLLVDTKSTEDGTLLFENVTPGFKYVLIEKSAPVGYEKLNDIEIDISLDDAENYKYINILATDKLIKNKIEIVKSDEETGAKLADAEFTLYRSLTGTADSDIIGTVKTGTDGIAVFDNLANGDYYIAETKAPTGYILNNSERIHVSFDKDEYEFKQITVANQRETIDIDITKVDGDDKDLKLINAEFEIYRVEDSREILVDTNLTNEDGHITFENLKKGYLYKIVESKVPTGYQAPSSNFAYINVPLDTPDKDLSLTVDNYKIDVDTPIDDPKVQIKIVKVDSSNHKVKLPNAEFEVYRIIGDNKIKVDYGYTNSAGEFITTGLDKGYSYEIIETKAPDGYEIKGSNSAIVNIDEDEQEVVIEHIRENNKITNSVNLKIVKVDADDKEVKLQGAEFSVYHKNDANEVTLVSKGVTDENGELTITGLIKGESYAVLETKAPTGYEIKGLASQDITIDKDTKEIEIEHIRENSKVITDAPKTDDSTNNLYYYVVGTIGIVGLVGTCVYMLKRKKESKI